NLGKRKAPDGAMDKYDPFVTESGLRRKLAKYTEDVKQSVEEPSRVIQEENKSLKSQLFEMERKINLLNQTINSLLSKGNPPVPDIVAQDRPETSNGNKINVSLSDIAADHNISGTVTEFQKKLSALKVLTGVKPALGTLNAEKKYKVSRVFVEGIQRNKISELKNALMMLSFRLSKILNIRFIGRFTAEFTVFSDYTNSFIGLMNSYKKFKVLPKMNPSLPLDKSAPLPVWKAVRESYYKSLLDTMKGCKNEILANYTRELGVELGYNMPPRDGPSEDRSNSPNNEEIQLNNQPECSKRATNELEKQPSSPNNRPTPSEIYPSSPKTIPTLPYFHEISTGLDYTESSDRSDIACTGQPMENASPIIPAEDLPCSMGGYLNIQSDSTIQTQPLDMDFSPTRVNILSGTTLDFANTFRLNDNSFLPSVQLDFSSDGMSINVSNSDAGGDQPNLDGLRPDIRDFFSRFI
ncbi:hypothetical protein AYI68_g4650, partial [Smittium mucronatum]